MKQPKEKYTDEEMRREMDYFQGTDTWVYDEIIYCIDDKMKEKKIKNLKNLKIQK